MESNSNNSVEARVKRALAENLTVSYVEPGDNGEAVVVRVPAKEAVRISRQCAVGIPDYEDTRSDEDCLFDYIIVNWAEIDFPKEER